jgi:hypothetical protein
MRKVKLSLDALQVESFATAATGAELRGTVAAHMPKPTPPLVETYYAGNTCGCTLAQSCIQTDCGPGCFLLTVDACTV